MTIAVNIAYQISPPQHLSQTLIDMHRLSLSHENTIKGRLKIIMTSSNVNIFRFTDPLWGESTGDRWIPITKTSDAVLWYFLLYALEQTFEQKS